MLFHDFLFYFFFDMDNFISLFVTLNPNVNETLTPTERASFIFSDYP